ncbi:hypothetical protein GA0116948_11311 [Chitinophaga costaii]|uniref:Lipocalin-like domain-containing protein n=1 Tax=Chitinophaga costaii TaxID=1335309 RepID=A0A1C4FA89_9BACT|nr:hypothetical protein [Chitinophaga costaii]PUZ20733.1 hypothetical protein DCM91_18410 [Chitinophaga costaii]SCC52919.1 hypothetical protein GA0116948_11311 [Chitinophaga costaii]
MTISKALCFCLLAIGFSTLAACKKEESASGTDASAARLEGTWKFAYMTGSTRATITETIDGQTQTSITLADFVTSNNAGTITMEQGKFTSNNVGYDMLYNILSISLDPEPDTLSVPYNYTVPPSSNSGTYKVIGDSLYTDAALVAVSTTGLGSTVPTTTGGKFSWSGDTLVLTSTIAIQNSTTESGITVSTNESAKVITKLVK